MKSPKKILSQLNILAQCKKYNLSPWQCPQFLFLVMGVLIIGSTIIAYIIGTRFIEDPLAVALVIVSLAEILITITVVITHSFERLAEASRMKSEFISIVSHQLRSPLSNLKWTIELLMSGKLGKIEKKQTEYFKILKENSNRMQVLISDLLTVSKIESAGLPLRQEEFYLQDLVTKLIARYKSFAGASNVEITFNSQKDLPKITSDPSQITLVLENLLDNSIRYIKDRGKVEVQISKKNKTIRLSVKDNGVGISKRDHKYIFQKFFRGENIMRYQTQGSGLGLYISKAIIKKAGGKLDFESEKNKGSTFWLTLPIK